MKATNRKGWSLILEMAAGGAVVCCLFIFMLFNTPLGNLVPDVFKLWGPISSWAIGVIFFIAHRTPDGYVEFKVRR